MSENKMTLNDYKKQMKDHDEWAPGWEAIEEVFENLYPDQTPAHMGTEIQARALFGGNQYLDGYSIYKSPNGYQHIVTYGMSDLYADEESFGGEWSRWGYEMTIKLKEKTPDDCMWAINMLSNLAHYTYTNERHFSPYSFIDGNGESIHIGTPSKITALLAVNDTEAHAIETVHGKVEFIQMVGITEQELDKLKEDPEKAILLVEKMKADNPYLITDMARTQSYL